MSTIDSERPRGRRYPMTVITRARELRSIGWSVPKIADILESEIGTRPADDTIRGWVNERYQRRRMARQADAQTRYRVKRASFKLGGGGHGITEDYLRAFIAALRNEGLSPNAIAGALRVQHDERWTRHMVDSVLGGGTPWMLSRER